MSIAFHIPVWLLWTLGIIGGLVILGLAILGIVFLRWIAAFNKSWGRIWGW